MYQIPECLHSKNANNFPESHICDLKTFSSFHEFKRPFMSFKFNTSVSDALYHLYTHFFQFCNYYTHNIIVLKCKRSHLFFQRLTSFLESGRKSFLNNVKVIESGFSIKMMFQNYFPRLHLSQQVMMITTTTTKEKFFTDGCTLMFFLFLLFTEKLSLFYPDLFLNSFQL